jgi:nucleoside-diphosphate-sugar epimerase
MLEVQSRCYREQYGRNFVCVIPTNIYGSHDNFNLDDAHVIPVTTRSTDVRTGVFICAPFIDVGSVGDQEVSGLIDCSGYVANSQGVF